MGLGSTNNRIRVCREEKMRPENCAVNLTNERRKLAWKSATQRSLAAEVGSLSGSVRSEFLCVTRDKWAAMRWLS